MAILCCFSIKFVECLDMIYLLPDVLLILIDISLLSNSLVCHLAVKLKLKKSLAFFSALLSELLLLVVQKSVEFYDCVPLVVLKFAGFSNLRKYLI